MRLEYASQQAVRDRGIRRTVTIATRLGWDHARAVELALIGIGAAVRECAVTVTFKQEIPTGFGEGFVDLSVFYPTEERQP